MQLGDRQAALGSDFQNLFETANQGICSKWLSEQADSATGYHPSVQPRLSARGNHDDRQSQSRAISRCWEIKPSHPGNECQ